MRRRKHEILRNASGCNVTVINNHRVYIKNTCAFDLLVEILTTAYCNYPLVKKYLDENYENLFLIFIKKYANKGISNSLYQERATILRVQFSKCIITLLIAQLILIG